MQIPNFLDLPQIPFLLSVAVGNLEVFSKRTKDMITFYKSFNPSFSYVNTRRTLETSRKIVIGFQRYGKPIGYKSFCRLKDNERN